MTYSPNTIPAKIESKEFAQGTKIIEFEKGNISNTHFLTIPYNSQNQAGAMVLINYLMSIDAQASKTFSKNWGDSTILDMNKIPENEKDKFSKDAIVIPNAVPELRAELVPIIEKIWTQEVLESEYKAEKVEEILQKIKILDAKDVITNNDEPAFAIKNKKRW